MTTDSRYSSTSITTRWDGKRVYQTTIYPNIEPSDSDIYIIAGDYDRLDKLANTYYKDSTYWWIIAQANNVGKGSLYVDEGTQLRIPMNLTAIISAFNSANES